MRHASRFLALLLGLIPCSSLGVSSVRADEPAKKKPHPRQQCVPQKAQRALIRSNYIKHGMLTDQAHARALRYRAETYGNVEGFGLDAYNSESAYSQAVVVKFMGLPLQIHKKVAPALRCVERSIRRSCVHRGERYTPRALGGFRTINTFRGGEISNHLFGIAVDIDPDRNPCCGCVSPWPDKPACRSDVASIYERAALPRCWIDAFERYGFYWLGRDPDLQDTMHFEFLGDPDLFTP
jgi:D-alanyl-D-alanine carboxypeptidase